MFLNDEQKSLALDIATRLIERGQTVAVAEATAGGLISAALLSVAGASRYYAGTTPEMLASLAESMRQRLGATWCLAESGLAGPTGGRFGAPVGRTTISVAGPVVRTEVMETGLADREDNMVEFTTRGLRFLSEAILDAKA
jgi:nicotinamide-nucleotide amidase